MNSVIGKLEVIGHERLIIPKGSDAWITFLDDKTRSQTRLQIIFEDTQEQAGTKEKKTPSIKIKGGTDHGILSFIDWKNSLGTATIEPVRLGQTADGSPMWFMAAAQAIGETRVLDIQLMKGGNV